MSINKGIAKICKKNARKLKSNDDQEITKKAKKRAKNKTKKGLKRAKRAAILSSFKKVDMKNVVKYWKYFFGIFLHSINIPCSDL